MVSIRPTAYSTIGEPRAYSTIGEASARPTIGKGNGSVGLGVETQLRGGQSLGGDQLHGIRRIREQAG